MIKSVPKDHDIGKCLHKLKFLSHQLIDGKRKQTEFIVFVYLCFGRIVLLKPFMPKKPLN